MIFLCASHINCLDRLYCLKKCLEEHKDHANICISISFGKEFTHSICEFMRLFLSSSCIILLQNEKKSQFQHYVLLIDYLINEKNYDINDTWIMFFDDDDRWTKERIFVYENVIAKALQNNMSIAKIDGNGYCRIKLQEKLRSNIYEKNIKDIMSTEDVKWDLNEYYMFSCTIQVLYNFLEKIKDIEQELLKHPACDILFRNYLCGHNYYTEEYNEDPFYFYNDKMDDYSSFVQYVKTTCKNLEQKTISRICHEIKDLLFYT